MIAVLQLPCMLALRWRLERCGRRRARAGAGGSCLPFQIFLMNHDASIQSFETSWTRTALVEKIFALIRRWGGSAAEEWPAYLWNSAEGPHPKDGAFSGAHVALPLPAEETQAAGKRGKRRGTSTTTHRERRSWTDRNDNQKGSVKRATAGWSQPA